MNLYGQRLLLVYPELRDHIPCLTEHDASVVIDTCLNYAHYVSIIIQSVCKDKRIRKCVPMSIIQDIWMGTLETVKDKQLKVVSRLIEKGLPNNYLSRNRYNVSFIANALSTCNPYMYDVYYSFVYGESKWSTSTASIALRKLVIGMTTSEIVESITGCFNKITIGMLLAEYILDKAYDDPGLQYVIESKSTTRVYVNYVKEASNLLRMHYHTCLCNHTYKQMQIQTPPEVPIVKCITVIPGLTYLKKKFRINERMQPPKFKHLDSATVESAFRTPIIGMGISVLELRQYGFTKAGEHKLASVVYGEHLPDMLGVALTSMTERDAELLYLWAYRTYIQCHTILIPTRQRLQGEFLCICAECNSLCSSYCGKTKSHAIVLINVVANRYECSLCGNTTFKHVNLRNTTVVVTYKKKKIKLTQCIGCRCISTYNVPLGVHMVCKKCYAKHVKAVEPTRCFCGEEGEDCIRSFLCTNERGQYIISGVCTRHIRAINTGGEIHDIRAIASRVGVVYNGLKRRFTA